MYSLEQLLEICEKKIQEFKFDREPRLLYEPIEYTLAAGGKRLRPVALLMAANMFTDDLEKAFPAAMAVEGFHNFTLLHDDIMDKADYRRSRPTVHVKWNENIAILSGDAMLICAYRLLNQSPEARLPQLLKTFNEFAIGVCEGQQYDINFENAENVSMQEYIRMITMKTSVLIAGALKMGALIGNASSEICESLYRFGIDLGIAFQIQDDLLDTYGDSKSFGKTIGGDIMVGKKTFLFISTLEKASKEDAERLKKLMSGNLPIAKKLPEVCAIYDKYGIQEYTQQAINDYFDKAMSILDSLPLEKERKAPLHELSMMLLKRNK